MRQCIHQSTPFHLSAQGAANWPFTIELFVGSESGAHPHHVSALLARGARRYFASLTPRPFARLANLWSGVGGVAFAGAMLFKIALCLGLAESVAT
jgi:hypothetical protein